MPNKYYKLIIFISLFVCISYNSLHAQYIVRTVAGSGAGGYYGGGSLGGDSGMAVNAVIAQTWGVAVDAKGNIYISDPVNYNIRKVAPNGIITTLVNLLHGYPSYSGDGGPATAAECNNPEGLAISPSGDLLISDGANEAARKVDTFGIISLFAGLPTHPGYSGDGIAATSAKLNGISDVAFDDAGNLYIADNTARIRKVTTDGVIHTVVGHGSIGFGGNGGQATNAAFDGLEGVCVDHYGNIYVADANNYVVRKVNATTGIVTAFAGVAGSSGSSGDGGLATSAHLGQPSDVAVDGIGNIYICDPQHNRIRKVDTSGHISTFAGIGSAGFSGDGGPPNLAAFNNPYAIWIDANDNMFVGDKFNHRVREIFKASHLTLSNNLGTPSICAGTPVTFYATTPLVGYGAIYRWSVNGVSVTGESASYTNLYPNNGDHVSCVLTDTTGGLNIPLATSDTMILTVTPVSYPTLSVTTTGDTVCAGLPVTLTAAISNAGPTPTLQWKKFTVPVDTGLVYTLTPANGDLVTFILTSSLQCAVPPVLDTTIEMTATPSYAPHIVLHAFPNDTISYWGQVVALYSDITFSGTAPVYQWFENGVTIPGATTSSYSAHFFANDTFYCVMTSNAPCAVPMVDTSNKIYISTGILAVTDVERKSDGISIAPNPNKGVFTISGIFAAGDVRAKVSNAIGTTVFTTKLNGQPGKANHQITLPANLPDGMYFLETMDNGSIRTVPFMLQY